MGVIWGQTRYWKPAVQIGDRHNIWPGGTGLLTRWTCPSAGRAIEAAPGHPDLGTGTMFGMPIGNVERPTFNSQLSTGVTERAHGGRDMGTDTVLGTGGANRGTDTTFGPGGPDF